MSESFGWDPPEEWMPLSVRTGDSQKRVYWIIRCRAWSIALALVHLRGYRPLGWVL